MSHAAEFPESWWMGYLDVTGWKQHETAEHCVVSNLIIGTFHRKLYE
jgi:hypothetical protein